MNDTPTPTGHEPGPSAANHAATASLHGYLHQTRWGLLELLRNIAEAPDLTLTMEMHDDIAWELGANLTELKQLKLHAKAFGTLGDMSDDMWRTLGVWLDAPRPGDPLGPKLVLVTNAISPKGSAAALLGTNEQHRDEGRALELLERAARKSENKDTAAARRKFRDLEPADRAALIGRMYVQDHSLDSVGVSKAIEERLVAGAPVEHFASYLEQVWGWWNVQVVHLLQGTRRAFSVGEVRRQLAVIRDRFSEDNLPTTVDEDEIGVTLLDHAERPYVHQLNWIGVRARVLERAVMDYERAFMQATTWLDRHLVTPAQMEKFVRDLTGEWEREFDHRCDNLPEEPTEDDKRRLGRDLLHDLSNTTTSIRPRYNDPFFARGQQHLLADRGVLGWHPDFEAHLENLLLGDDEQVSA